MRIKKKKSDWNLSQMDQQEAKIPISEKCLFCFRKAI